LRFLFMICFDVWPERNSGFHDERNENIGWGSEVPVWYCL